MATLVEQKLSSHLIEVPQSFVQEMNENFSKDDVYRNVLPSMFVDIDNTAVIF